jgi:hypothetical protein
LNYARERDGRLQLLIVNSDGGDGLEVLQMNVSGKARNEWISEPASSAEHNGARIGERARE